MGEQWPLGRALAVAALSRLLRGAGRACAAPFLPLFLRLLGLPAPLVGAVAGARGLAAALGAAPLGCPRGRGKRRLLLVGSLVGSAGASLGLTLIPPARGAAGAAGCNHSGHGVLAAVPSAEPSLVPSAVPIVVPTMSRDKPRDGALTASAVANARAVSKETVRTTAGGVLAASRMPAPSGSAFQGLFGTRVTLKENSGGVGEGGTKARGHSDGPPGWRTDVEDINRETQEAEKLASYRPSFPGLKEEMNSVGSTAADLAEESLSATASNEPSLIKTTLSTVAVEYMSENLSDSQDVNFEAAQSILQDREHQIFLLVLGAVVLWELLGTSLERAVDEGVYEYLDFVDATDRYGRLWMWSSLGAAAGACGVAVLVDQLNCFLSGSISRLAVHFYGYAVLVTLSLLVSAFFPRHSAHIPRKTDRGFPKALALLWSDGRALLCAGTVFLAGAASSAGHNFLFWQMQDQGSSELLMGLSVSVGLLAELLLWPFRGRLLRALSSGGVAAVGVGLLAAQLLCYSLLRHPWAVLPVQALSAFSSGALWWALEVTVGDIAPPGTERSLRAVLRGLCCGAGASVGSFAGGFVVERFGLAVLFRACCAALALWLFVFFIVQSKLPRQKNINYSRLLAADSSDMSDSDEESEKDWLVKAMKDESFNRNWIQ
ncbi:major facilitator superfamily domain-containing protein 6-like [Neopelma chrysocephalum]|uniref:major facilitator superfamily domain-containing protein 6-like n=1 Tax=Neopelma chrysocephalum TaxID=114329 RepID=UPI000FCD124B|nr:major facilitator superfamily domain-containing protein 6-like [Neopelma chrysocephalum]